MYARILWSAVIAAGCGMPAVGASPLPVVADGAGGGVEAWEVPLTPGQCRWYAEHVLHVDADLGRASAPPDQVQADRPRVASSLLMTPPAAPDTVQLHTSDAPYRIEPGTVSRPLPAGGRPGRGLLGFVVPTAAGILAAGAVLLAAGRRQA